MMALYPASTFSGKESDMTMPPLLRAVFHVTLASLLMISLYVCIQGVIMLYDVYQFIDWVEEVAYA